MVISIGSRARTTRRSTTDTQLIETSVAPACAQGQYWRSAGRVELPLPRRPPGRCRGARGLHDGRQAQRLAKLASAGDYGLLVPVSTVRTRDDALMLRELLREAGIRANVSEGELPGEQVVLVFRSDATRAKQLV